MPNNLLFFGLSRLVQIRYSSALQVLQTAEDDGLIVSDVRPCPATSTETCSHHCPSPLIPGKPKNVKIPDVSATGQRLASVAQAFFRLARFQQRMAKRDKSDGLLPLKRFVEWLESSTVAASSAPATARPTGAPATPARGGATPAARFATRRAGGDGRIVRDIVASWRAWGRHVAGGSACENAGRLVGSVRLDCSRLDVR
jgi:hypothetical protein